MFIDLKKAFDTISYDILIKKLQIYGIRGIASQWIISYLKLRQQYVMFNGIDSVCKRLRCGVPQGSILGTLLFINYVSHLRER